MEVLHKLQSRLDLFLGKIIDKGAEAFSRGLAPC
jgi:hypothetical protein